MEERLRGELAEGWRSSYITDSRRVAAGCVLQEPDSQGEVVDYVVWQWHVPELWRRFGIALQRDLAKRCGLSMARFRKRCKISYSKVAESRPAVRSTSTPRSVSTALQDPTGQCPICR